MILPRPLTTIIDRVPLSVTQRVVGTVFAQVMKQHARLFDRLGDYANKQFGFTPSDLNLSFVIQPARRVIRVYRGKAPKVDAGVSGPLVTLLALLEGRIDGDAVFFSRELELTGDMEAVLALRNALDDSGFDLPRDLSPVAGPFAPLFKRIAEGVRARALGELA